MTHRNSTRAPRDEALVRDSLKQAFDAPLTTADLADGEAAVRSLAATMPTGRSVVGIGGRRRRRVAAAVAAGVFVLSSGAAAAGGGDPLAGARRMVRVIVPAPAPEQPVIESRLFADAEDDRSDDPASPLAPTPPATVSAEAHRSEPVPSAGSQPAMNQTDPHHEPQPSDKEDEPEHPDSDHGDSDDAPTAHDDDEDDEGQRDDVTADADSNEPIAAEAAEAAEDAQDAQDTEDAEDPEDVEDAE